MYNICNTLKNCKKHLKQKNSKSMMNFIINQLKNILNLNKNTFKLSFQVISIYLLGIKIYCVRQGECALGRVDCICNLLETLMLSYENSLKFEQNIPQKKIIFIHNISNKVRLYYFLTSLFLYIFTNSVVCLPYSQLYKNRLYSLKVYVCLPCLQSDNSIFNSIKNSHIS